MSPKQLVMAGWVASPAAQGGFGSSGGTPFHVPRVSTLLFIRRLLKHLLHGWRLAAGVGLLITLPGPAWSQERLNYGAWQLVLAEEFDAPTDTVDLGTRWRFAYPWGRTLLGNPEAEYYSASEVRPDSGGILRLTAHAATPPIAYQGKKLRYTAGMLMSRYRDLQAVPATCPPDEGFSFGLFEIRCRQPGDPNAFPAFWLYGGAPDEIDIFEATPTHFGNNFIRNPNNYWWPTRLQSVGCSCTYYDHGDPAGNLHQQYHTYSLSWLPNEVILYFDGIPIRRETRLLPTGCAMRLIVNLAMWDWASARTDALAVDYIRVYRPQQRPHPGAGQRPSAEIPASELAWLPAEQPPGRADPGTFQGWQLRPAAGVGQRLSLELTDNYNPPCDLLLPLPVAGHWAPAWVQTAGVPELRVAVPASSDSLHWTIADAQGNLRRRGAAAGGQPWRPNWSDLPPGAYVLHLTQGPGHRAHPLRVIDRPAGSGPTPEWLAPPPAPSSK